MNYFLLTTIIWAVVLAGSAVLLSDKKNGFIITTLIACIDTIVATYVLFYVVTPIYL